jgi:hypothetical protein
MKFKRFLVAFQFAFRPTGPKTRQKRIKDKKIIKRSMKAVCAMARAA